MAVYRFGKMERSHQKNEKMKEKVPASNGSKEVADNHIFLIREFTMFNVGPEVV